MIAKQKPRVGFIVQRYGMDFAGGAESMARLLAEHIQQHWDVTVLTSCARDYRSWANEYPEGKIELNGVKVHRFPVEKPRDFETYSQYAYARESKAFRLPHQDELDHFVEQGPYCPSLVEYLKQHKESFDFFFFFTYLYYPTVMGLPQVADKAYLMTTAHDEPPFYFIRTYAPLFHSLRGIIYLTERERELINRVYPLPAQVKQIQGGYGAPRPLPMTPEEESELVDQYNDLLETPYFLYLGRASETKKCYELIHAYIMMTGDYHIPAKLVFAGSLDLDLGEPRSDIRYVGFVSEKERSFLLKHARALVNPSSLESLSQVILEAWSHQTPVIVNGASDVMKSLCDESQGGIYYHSEAMFRGLLAWAAQNPNLCKVLGEKGRQFVETRFNWTQVVSRLVEQLC